MSDFKLRHFRGDVISWAVRWYCKYRISYRNLEEILDERGIKIDHTILLQSLATGARSDQSDQLGLGRIS